MTHTITASARTPFRCEAQSDARLCVHYVDAGADLPELISNWRRAADAHWDGYDVRRLDHFYAVTTCLLIGLVNNGFPARDFPALHRVAAPDRSRLPGRERTRTLFDRAALEVNTVSAIIMGRVVKGPPRTDADREQAGPPPSPAALPAPPAARGEGPSRPDAQA